MAQNMLLIQDDAADTRLVQEALSDSRDNPFRVEWVRRCSEGLERLLVAEELAGLLRAG